MKEIILTIEQLSLFGSGILIITMIMSCYFSHKFIRQPRLINV